MCHENGLRKPKFVYFRGLSSQLGEDCFGDHWPGTSERARVSGVLVHLGGPWGGGDSGCWKRAPPKDVQVPFKGQLHQLRMSSSHVEVTPGLRGLWEKRTYFPTGETGDTLVSRGIVGRAAQVPLASRTQVHSVTFLRGLEAFAWPSQYVGSHLCSTRRHGVSWASAHAV